jgi:hypothetical protein
MVSFIINPITGILDADSGSGSTYSPYHTTTQAYIASLGETPSDIVRVDQCIRALDAAGILDDLVDACFMRTTQNLSAGTSLKSLYGVTGTITGSPTIGQSGVLMNGTSQYGSWVVADSKVATASVNFTGITSGQTSSACILCLQNSTGWSSGAGTGTNIQMICNGSNTGYVFTGESGSVAVTDPWWVGTYSSLTLHPVNPYTVNYCVSNDNAASPTIKMYANGVLCATDSSANVQSTGTRTEMVIGCRRGNGGVGGAGNFAKGVYTHWFLFNKVLSDSEVAAFHAATRWLDPKTKNIVYLGDSTSAFFFTKPVDSWSYQYQHMIDPASALHINVAVNGWSAATMDGLYDSRVKPFRALANGVEEADLFIWLGINDINTGATSSAVIASLRSIWAKARRDGFTVHVSTLMPGTSYTAPMLVIRDAVNTSIISDNNLYDSLFRADLFFPDPNDSTYYLDGFHLKTLGNAALANARATEMALENIPPKMYPLVDGATIATDASLVPNDAVAYVTLAGNRVLSNPTNPTAGQRIVYKFIQDATGSRTITLDTKFRAGVYTITLSTTALATNYMEVVYNLPDDKWDVVWWNGAGPAASAGGADTQIQYNNTGALAGDSGLTYDYTNKYLALTGAWGTTGTSVLSQLNSTSSSNTNVISNTWQLKNSAAAYKNFFQINVTSDNATSGAERSVVDFAGMYAGSASIFFSIIGTGKLLQLGSGVGLTVPSITASSLVSTNGSSKFTASTNPLIASVGITIDGGGSAITTGVKGYIEVPYACTINQVTLLADQSGSCVIDIWKDTYANYPPTVADTITASAKPTISAATKSQDATLTGWTTSISAGDILGFNVDSASTVTRVHLILKVTKTV